MGSETNDLALNPSLQICDKIKHPVVVSVLANVFLSIGFLLIGPAPFFLDSNPTALSIKCSGGILGAGFAMVTVSTFGRSQSAAVRNGYNDDMDTYMLISSNFDPSTILTTEQG